MLHRSSIRLPKLIASCCVAVSMLMLAGAAYAQSGGNGQWTTLTFNSDVQLPGLRLPAGAYTFQHVKSHAANDLVEVWSVTPRKLVGRFRAVPDSRRAAGQPVKFREHAARTAPAIDTWYVDGGTAGYQFLYSTPQLRALAAPPAVKTARAD